jgi:acetyl esterase/lipase
LLADRNRLAPEHPFPAAVYDSFETVLWTVGEGQQRLNLNPKKAAIGGASAGANLAAVMTQRVSSRPYLSEQITFRKQLHVVPVMDNTALVETSASYKEFQYTPGLSAEKMLWYRDHYLPLMHTRFSPEASPLLLPPEQFNSLPPAVIVVGEVDIVRDDGQEYARKLREAGVEARLEVMLGVPHAFISHDAELEAGRRAVEIMCEGLREAVGSDCDEKQMKKVEKKEKSEGLGPRI